MKKTKKTALTALILTSAVSMTSCDWFSVYQNVYGPPVDMSSEPPTTEYDPYYDDIQSEYEAPIVEEMTEQATTEEVTEIQTTTESADVEYNPVDDIPVVVYGPPPDME